jgi:RNA polymerase sigma factor for flagellar operon FliA
MSMIEEVHSLAPSTLMSDRERQLWAEWCNQRSASSREQLIMLHLEFARIIAAKLYLRRYNDEFEFAEYMQFATVGMIESIDRFNPDKQFTFRTFSAPRISGAILDGISRLSEQHQQISMRRRILSERAESIRHAEAGVANRDVLEQLADIAIGLALGYMLEGSTMYQSQEPTAPSNSYSAIQQRQLQERVRSLVDGLPERERLVISYHYLHQIRFETIAEMLSVSKGRVSQLHRSGLERLRSAASKVASCDLAW